MNRLFLWFLELKMYSLMMTANGHIDPRGTMAPPIIMHTAATPMPTPKSSLGPESILEEELMYREGITQHGEDGRGVSETGTGNLESRRGSSTSMDPSAYDQRSLVSNLNSFTAVIRLKTHSCRRRTINNVEKRNKNPLIKEKCTFKVLKYWANMVCRILKHHCLEMLHSLLLW